MPLSDDTKSKLASIKKTAFNRAGGQDPSVIVDAILENDGSLDGITILTDNSGGTANDTLEDSSTAVTGVDGTGSNAASKADVDARLVSISNNLADLAAKVNEIINALNG